MTAIENQKLLLILTKKADLHSRILLKITESNAEILRHMKRFHKPMEEDEKGISPILNEELRRVLPFNSNVDVAAFFNTGPTENPEDTRARLLLLQRYVVSQVSWSVSTFVYRMVRLICSKNYRRTHYIMGHVK